MSSYANFLPKEGTVTTEVTLTWDMRCKQFLIMNDSLSINLWFKFNSTESWGTLKPDEQVSMDMNHKTVIIRSSDGVTAATYRIWGIG